MPDPAPLRWGILGCARIARRGLIPGIRGSASGTLLGIASRDPASAARWAEEFSIPKSYGSYEDLVADPEVQAVYVPLPNELHRPWALAAADAGKHVLCEKPLSLDAAEARAMVDHCRSRGVILMEAFMWRHQPRTAGVRTLIADGAIGQLRLIRVSFSFTIDPGDWRLEPGRGAGALWDIGTYGVSTARLYAGSEPEQVRVTGRFSPGGVDLSLAISLGFPGGILASIDCSFEQPFRCHYELVGTAGSIEVPDAFLPPGLPTATLKAGDDSPGALNPGGLPRVIPFDGRDQYACMVDAFAASVAAGGLVDPAEDGLGQMAALDSALAAARKS